MNKEQIRDDILSISPNILYVAFAPVPTPPMVTVIVVMQQQDDDEMSLIRRTIVPAGITVTFAVWVYRC